MWPNHEGEDGWYYPDDPPGIPIIGGGSVESAEGYPRDYHAGEYDQPLDGFPAQVLDQLAEAETKQREASDRLRAMLQQPRPTGAITYEVNQPSAFEQETEMYADNPPPNQTRADRLRDRIAREEDRAAARIERLQAELALVESLPEEPRLEGDDHPVITFKRRFTEGGRDYVYAAVRGTDGLWNTTGPQSPKAYTWEELIQWIALTMDPDGAQVWVATEWSDLVEG